jgi:hypothetical protein
VIKKKYNWADVDSDSDDEWKTIKK